MKKYINGKYVDLTFGVSGATYTAPANGWYAARKITSASGGYLDARLNTGLTIASQASSSNWGVAVYLPVKRGDIMTLYYANITTIDTSYFRFIYAEGEL